MLVLVERLKERLPHLPAIDGAALVRTQERIEALIAEKERFNYEKVFFDSLFQFGVFGLGWLMVKFGWLLAMISDPQGVFSTRVFKKVIDWVEGSNQNTRIPGHHAYDYTWTMIAVFRENAEAYADFKTYWETKKEELGPEFQILDILDGIYADYGSIAPLIILGANLFFERKRMGRTNRVN